MNLNRRLVLITGGGCCLVVVAIRLIVGGLSGPTRPRAATAVAADLADGGPTQQQARLAAELAAAATAVAPAPDGKPARPDRARHQAQMNAYKAARDPQVRAALILGLARSRQYTAIPLLLTAIEDDHPVVAGRAIAAVQQLLGVRYPVAQKRLRDPKHRSELAGMAREDWQKLRNYPRFQQEGT